MVPYPDFRVWFKGTIPWFQGIVWRNHTLISGYHTLKSGHQTLKSWYGTGKQIFKITVKWPFLTQFIIRIYNFEVNMLMHLNFWDPTVKFFIYHPKKLHCELEDLVGLGVCVGFSISPPQIFPFLIALRGYFQNFHMSS